MVFASMCVMNPVLTPGKKGVHLAVGSYIVYAARSSTHNISRLFTCARLSQYNFRIISKKQTAVPLSATRSVFFVNTSGQVATADWSIGGCRGELNIELMGFPKLKVYAGDLFHTLVNVRRGGWIVRGPQKSIK